MKTVKRKTTTRQTQTGAADAIEILQEDHRAVEKIFKEFDKLHESDSDEESKRGLVERACAALTVHTQIEEEIFYPAVHDLLRDAMLGEEALIEHAAAKDLIAQLEGLEPGEPFYDATFTVLAEYVKHHVQEEEKEMFPQVRQAKAKVDLEALGVEMQQRKDELKDEDGTAEGGEEDETDERARMRSTAAASKAGTSNRSAKRSRGRSE